MTREYYLQMFWLICVHVISSKLLTGFIKLTIVNVFPYLICYSWDYLKVFFHTLVTAIVKTWRMSGRWKWRRENVQSGKSSSGNSPFWEVSIVELSFGEVSAGNLSVHGELSIGELSRYQFICETFSELTKVSSTLFNELAY